MKINKKRKEGDSEQFVHGDEWGARGEVTEILLTLSHATRKKEREKQNGSSSRPARQEKNTVGKLAGEPMKIRCWIIQIHN